MDKIWKESWASYGVKGYLILIADQQGGPPNEAACKKYRDDYQLGLTLLYDPTGATAQYGVMETTCVELGCGTDLRPARRLDGRN